MLQVQLTQFGVIAQGNIQTTEAQLDTALVKAPDRFVLHPQRLPQRFRGVFADRFTSGAFQHPGQNLCIRADVVKHFTGGTGGGQVGDHFTYRVAEQKGAIEQHVDIGKLLVINLAETNTAGHSQQVANWHLAPGFAIKFLHVVFDGIIKAVDVAAFHGDGRQHTDHGLGHRPGGKAIAGIGSLIIIFQYLHTVMQHGQAGGLGALEEFPGSDYLTFMSKGGGNDPSPRAKTKGSLLAGTIR